MPTPFQIQSANSIAREFTISAVDGRRYEAQEVVNDMVRAVDNLRAMGVDKAYLADTLAGLLDVAANIDAGCERDLDAAGTWTPEKVDVSEVQALLERVS